MRARELFNFERLWVSPAALLLVVAMATGCSDTESPDCSTRDDCGAGLICRSGVCVVPPDSSCSSDDECILGEFCQAGVCTPAEDNNGVQCVHREDCTVSQVCSNGLCAAPGSACIGDDECLVGKVCQGGQCIVETTTNNPNNNPNNEDKTPPMIVSFTPADGATGVALDARVTIKFSEPLRDVRIAEAITFHESGNLTGVPFTVALATDTITITPTLPLFGATPYEVRISNDIFDEAGNKMQDEARWSFSTAVTPEPEHRALALQFAPIVYQEVTDDGSQAKVDYFTAVDFDGDFNANNNFGKYRSTAIPGAVYYTVVESITHTFIEYLFYYPANRNTNDGAISPHDVAAVTVVVTRGASPTFVMAESCYGTTCTAYALDTAAVSDGSVADIDYSFPATELYDGSHYLAYGGNGRHGSCAWNWQSAPQDLAPWCNHNPGEFKNDARSVVYYPAETGLGPADVTCTGETGCAPPTVSCNGTYCADSQDQRALTYSLEDFRSSLWVRRVSVGDDQLYAAQSTYAPHADSGDRPGRDQDRTFPSSFATSETDARGDLPFVWNPGGALSNGQWWVDPAYALSTRYNFEGLNATYCYNPYFDIDIRSTAPQCQ